MPRRKDWNVIVQEKSDNFDSRIDTSDSRYIYFGKTIVGNYLKTSQALWQVIRFDTQSPGGFQFANADDSFTNIWDNRATLTYT